MEEATTGSAGAIIFRKFKSSSIFVINIDNESKIKSTF